MNGRIAIIGLYGMTAFFHTTHLPQIGETISSKQLTFEEGGKGFNQALSTVRAGANVLFITAVGDDIHGREANNVFQNYGIIDNVCLKISNATTAFASVISDEQGNNIVIVDQGAIRQLPISLIDKMEDRISTCNVMLLQCEIPDELICRALEIGKKHGLYTILNPAPARQLPYEIVEKVDLITPNLIEAATIAKKTMESPEVIALQLQKMGFKNIVITLGNRGCLIKEVRKNSYYIDGYKVKCIDSTGAGDNFNGMLAACLASGKTIAESASMAIASSALCVTKQGVLSAIPTFEEVIEFKNKMDI